LLKRPPSSHSSSSHEGLIERISDTASRTAASSYSGIEGIYLSQGSFCILGIIDGKCDSSL
jgi:hypothetical protein